MIDSMLLSILLLQINLLPLLFIPFFDITFEFPKYIVFLFLSGILLILHSIKVSKSSFIIIPKNKIVMLLFIVFFSYAISSIFSVSPITSLFGLREMYTGGLIYYMCLIITFYTAFSLKKYTEVILKNIVFAGFAVSLFGIGEYFLQFLNTHTWLFRVSSTIGQPVRLSLYLLAILPISFSFMLKEKNILQKKLFSLITFIISVTFFFTFTRSAYIIFFLIIFYLLFQLSKIQLLKKINYFTVIFAIIAILFGIITIQRIPKTYSQFLSSSLSSRLNEWKTVRKVFQQQSIIRKIIGTGPDTIYFTYPKQISSYKKIPLESSLKIAPLQVRNHYINLLSTIGIVGLIFYLLLARNIFINIDQIKDHYLKIGLSSSFLAILLLSIFYYQTDNQLLIFWIIAGLSFSLKSQKFQFSLIHKSKVQITLFIFGIFLSIYSLSTIISESITSVTKSEIPVTIAYYLNPFDQTNALQLSRTYYNIAKEQLFIDPIKAHNYLTKSLQILKTNQKLFPLYRENHYSLATTYYWAGLHVSKNFHYDAISNLNILTQIDPSNYYYSDQIGLSYLALGQFDHALSYFNHALIQDPEYAGVYLHIGELLKQQGKYQEALNNYRIALKIQPEWNIAKTQIKQIQALIDKKNSQINLY